MNHGFCGMGFPVLDRDFVCAYQLCYLPLKEAEVESAFADMVTDSGKSLWVRNREGFWSRPPQVTKEQ